MTTEDKWFAKEEDVRKAREENGREHDCKEAGCTLAPDGTPVIPGSAPERKPLDQAILDEIQELKDAGVLD